VADRVVLAHSGGPDPAPGIGRLRDATGKDVVALVVDLGQEGEDLEALRQRALDSGAVESIVVDAKDEFADDHLVRALAANALHHRRSPLVSALSGPLVAQHAVRTAAQFGADSVVHPAAGTGDDHVRFEAAVAALAPGLTTVVPPTLPGSPSTGSPSAESQWVVDQNLWGRTVRTGALEDPWAAPTEDLYSQTQDPTVPREPDEVTITFERGVPVAIDGQRFTMLRVVQELNALAGKHGVGRSDVIEDRVVGIKSRELHEAPAAETLITAHEELERLTLERDVIRYKRGVEAAWVDLVHDGLWFGGLRRSLDAFIDHTQAHVSGDVRVRLHGGRAVVTGLRSSQSLYDFALATADTGDGADRPPVAGFTEVWSRPSRVAARRDLAN
jgi:argininosuccinate synthase